MWYTFYLTWIKMIGPLCFIQLCLITLQTHIMNIYMYKYPHAHTHDPPPQHWWDYMWYVGLRTRFWLASDACPCKGDPNLRVAWNNYRCPSGAALTLLTFTQLHLLAHPLLIFLMFVLLLLPLQEPLLQLLLQHLEVTLHVPHLLNIILNCEVWGLLLPNGSTIGIIAKQHFAHHTLLLKGCYAQMYYC